MQAAQTVAVIKLRGIIQRGVSNNNSISTHSTNDGRLMSQKIWWKLHKVKGVL